MDLALNPIFGVGEIKERRQRVVLSSRASPGVSVYMRHSVNAIALSE